MPVDTGAFRRMAVTKISICLVLRYSYLSRMCYLMWWMAVHNTFSMERSDIERSSMSTNGLSAILPHRCGQITRRATSSRPLKTSPCAVSCESGPGPILSFAMHKCRAANQKALKIRSWAAFRPFRGER